MCALEREASGNDCIYPRASSLQWHESQKLLHPCLASAHINNGGTTPPWWGWRWCEWWRLSRLMKQSLLLWLTQFSIESMEASGHKVLIWLTPTDNSNHNLFHRRGNCFQNYLEQRNPVSGHVPASQRPQQPLQFQYCNNHFIKDMPPLKIMPLISPCTHNGVP